ncbi:MAG: pyridoxamine 5'-phosphate oxidase family protein [Clostridiales bacterium]|nr:pyridoxamine 5'-phosphate oxidase family protein [Clostridiales bacterium]
MEQRMKEFAMTDREIAEFLLSAAVGRISTFGSDGYPYTVAVHFVMQDGNIYFHCLPWGEKMGNIKNNRNVCFEVDEFIGLAIGNPKNPCKTGSKYKSVVIRGTAEVVDETALKEKALTEIVRKYTPQLKDIRIPEENLTGTAVVKITPKIITGKAR